MIRRPSDALLESLGSFSGIANVYSPGGERIELFDDSTTNLTFTEGLRGQASRRAATCPASPTSTARPANPCLGLTTGRRLPRDYPPKRYVSDILRRRPLGSCVKPS